MYRWRHHSRALLIARNFHVARIGICVGLAVLFFFRLSLSMSVHGVWVQLEPHVVNEDIQVAIARRFHLFPFRTEKLSFASPMVLRKWESRQPPF